MWLRIGYYEERLNNNFGNERKSFVCLLRDNSSSSHSRALFVLRFPSRRLEKEKIRNNRADDELRRSFGWISLDELLLRTLSRPCEVDLRPSSTPRIISTMSVEETISKSSSPVRRVSGAAAVATKTSSRVKSKWRSQWKTSLRSSRAMELENLPEDRNLSSPREKLQIYDTKDTTNYSD